MSTTSEEQNRSRVVFLGSGKVGKTSIIRRFLNNQFDTKYQATVEEIYYGRFEVRDHIIQLEFLDTSGSYDFPAMRRICISRAAALVLVFSQDDPYSFDQVKELYTQIIEEREDFSSLPIIVVCNKSDLTPKNDHISPKNIDKWISDVNLPDNRFIYASAQSGNGINPLFKKLWDQNWTTRKITCQPVAGRSGSAATLEFHSEKRRLSATAILTNPDEVGTTMSNLTLQEPIDAHTKSPRKLFRNKFASSMRRPSTKRSKHKEAEPAKKIDCVIS